jgi:formylmethanofuran dehydrogenase subunit E
MHYDDTQLALINAAFDEAAEEDKATYTEVGMPFLDDNMFVCDECGDIFVSETELPKSRTPVCQNCLAAIFGDLAQQDDANSLNSPN